MKSEVCTGYLCEVDLHFRIKCCNSKFIKSLGYIDEIVTGRRLLFSVEMEKELMEKGEYSGFAVILGAKDIVYYAIIDIARVAGGYRINHVEIRSAVDIDFWEKMFRKMPLPVMIISKNHTIVDLNDEMLLLVGKRREEVLGTKCHTLMHNLSHPPGDCPLIDAVGKDMEHNLNMMDTVLGKFLISVVKIDENLYAHYAIKEVALLMEMQNRIMDILKRYNRILIAATVINEEMLAGRDIDFIIQGIGEKIKEIEGFYGAEILKNKNGEWMVCFSYNVSLSPEKIINAVDDNKFTIIREGEENYYVFPMTNIPQRAIFVLSMKNEELTDEEIKTILSSIDHLGDYISAKMLEEKREMAYQYISNVMSDFAMLVDRIRNPLATLSLFVEMEIENPELRKVMMDKISEIQEITKKIDELWNRAEEMQKVLKGENMD